MSDHVHEWKVRGYGPLIARIPSREFPEDFTYTVRCKCDEVLGFEDIARRLNATERLSLDLLADYNTDLELLWIYLGGAAWGYIGEALIAYASALEGDKTVSPYVTGEDVGWREE